MCLEKEVCKFKGDKLFQNKRWKTIFCRILKPHSKAILDAIITITAYFLTSKTTQTIAEARLKNFQNRKKTVQNQVLVKNSTILMF